MPLGECKIPSVREMIVHPPVQWKRVNASRVNESLENLSLPQILQRPEEEAEAVNCARSW